LLLTHSNHQRPEDGPGTQVKTNLRRIRFERGDLSQQELAERVAVSRQTIVAIERGNYSPSVKLALLLARTLGVTVEQLFELEKGDYVQTR